MNEATNRPIPGMTTLPQPAPVTPLNGRLASALNRLEVQVQRSENILNRLRVPGPEAATMAEEPAPYAHELADRIDRALDLLDRNTNHILDIL